MSKKDLYKNIEFLQLSLNDSYKSLNEKLNKIEEVNFNLNDMKDFLCLNYETMKNYIDESLNLTKSNIINDQNLTNLIVNKINKSIDNINIKNNDLEFKISNLEIKIDDINHKFEHIYSMFRTLNSRLDNLELSVMKMNNYNNTDSKFYYKEIINENNYEKYNFYILILILLYILITNISYYLI
jgi:chromosome segregation ATPase